MAYRSYLNNHEFFFLKMVKCASLFYVVCSTWVPIIRKELFVFKNVPGITHGKRTNVMIFFFVGRQLMLYTEKGDRSVNRTNRRTIIDPESFCGKQSY